MPSLTEKEIDLFRNQVAGWQVMTDADGRSVKIRSEWEMRNFSAALQFFERIGEMANAEGHHPDLHLTSYRHVCVELSTHAVNGLTENDFIIAAKINAMDVSDLLKKKKKQNKNYWA